MRYRALFPLAAFLFSVLPLWAFQSSWQPKDKGLSFNDSHSSTEWVQLVSPAGLSLRAGQAQNVTLQFQIKSGLHINSHTPHSPYLIPTSLTLDAPSGMRIAQPVYPQGTEYHFQFSPKEALVVYTGEFAVNAAIKAAPGKYTVHGKLHYQACDNRMCNPPKTLLFAVPVTAR